MNKTEVVRNLIAKYFWAMPDDASLSTGKKVCCLKRPVILLKSMLLRFG